MKILAAFTRRQYGYLLLALLFLIPMFWLLWSLTLDGTNAKYTAGATKRALNRAVKAAVLAVDKEALATGELRLNAAEARSNFERMLGLNLGLNADFTPSEQSPLLEAPEILDYYLYQGPDFPYTYHTLMDITYTFHDPGVLALVKVRQKYGFTGQIQEIYAYAAAEARR